MKLRSARNSFTMQPRLVFNSGGSFCLSLSSTGWDCRCGWPFSGRAIKWVRKEVYKTFERSPDSFLQHAVTQASSGRLGQAASSSSVFSQCHFCVNWFHFALKIIVDLVELLLVDSFLSLCSSELPSANSMGYGSKTWFRLQVAEKAFQTKSGLFKLASLKPICPLLAHTGTLQITVILTDQFKQTPLK